MDHTEFPPNNKAVKVLIVEDLPTDAELTRREIGKAIPQSVFKIVETREDYLNELATFEPDIVVSDYRMPRFNGMEALKLAMEHRPLMPVIIVTSAMNEDTAVDCMKAGASNYVIKEHIKRLGQAVVHALEEAKTRRQRAQVEESLRKSELAFRGLFNASPVGIALIVHRTLLKVNPSWCRITGYSDCALEGKSLRMFHRNDESYERTGHMIYDQLTHADRVITELPLRRQNGEDFEALVYMSPVDPQDSSSGFICTLIDITERKQAELEKARLQEQLNQAQKMESIGRLAGGIAHDFNNILSGIIGYAELVAMRADDATRQYVEHILQASERARNLIKQILAFSRRVEQDRKPMDYRSVVAEALKLLRATLSTTIEMRSKSPAAPVMVDADYTQMHQVIMNICTNAAHAMGEKGGVLEVSLNTVNTKDESRSDRLDLPPGAYARLAISDTGHGIDPVHLNRLFDPFFTTKKPGEGTGLGLAVVYGIVHNHGGCIAVSSAPGQGATFSVYLPLIENISIQNNGHETKNIPRGHERILLVDDESELVDLGYRILSGLGYQVTGCSSSSEALRIYSADPSRFDLVITDMNMPSVSGSELAMEMLKVRKDQAIILCTGHSDYIDSEKSAKIGISAFALKPLTRETLATLVRTVIDGHIAPKPAR